MNGIFWKLQLFGEGGEGSGASGESPAPAEAPAPEKPAWEALMEDPDYRQRLEETVQSRLEEAAQAEKARAEAEAQAARQERETRESQARQRFQQLQSHFRSLEEQAQRVKALYPGFDLARELRNPMFARMTHPSIGIGVEDAFFALHREELQGAAMAAAAEKTAQKLSQAIQSGSLRPRESGGAAPSLSTFREGQTKEQREALKRRIREAAARGEKIYPQG